MHNAAPLNLILTEREENTFWSKVRIPINPDACWDWQAWRDKEGYGGVKIRQKSYRAARIAYSLCKGMLPALLVLHRCDNPSCVNPDHLFLGTAKDNYDDATQKGRARHVCGEALNHNRITEALAQRIVERYRTEVVTQYQLAKDYNVSQSRISAIVTGQSWKHLNLPTGSFVERKSSRFRARMCT